MAKNRNKKKKRDGAVSMDTAELSVSDHPQPQAMDTSESGAPKPASGSQIRVKKGKQMKRAKNIRKMKAIAKAISLNEKSGVKIAKNESKTSRTKSAKLLYD